MYFYETALVEATCLSPKGTNVVLIGLLPRVSLPGLSLQKRVNRQKSFPMFAIWTRISIPW